jgi:hypothetical protein
VHLLSVRCEWLAGARETSFGYRDRELAGFRTAHCCACVLHGALLRWRSARRPPMRLFVCLICGFLEEGELARASALWRGGRLAR